MKVFAIFGKTFNILNISEDLEYLRFWINKKQGAYYSSEELCSIIDRGQMSAYTDFKTKYATSTLIKEILSPFKKTYNFTPSNTISGVIVLPSDSNYLDVLDIQIEVDISSRIIYSPVQIVNEDQRAYRLNSQVSPVTVSKPIAEIITPDPLIGARYFKMYPAAGYRGTVTYLKRPVKPVFGYTLVSGRREVYNPDTSTQLEWRDSEHNYILLKSLQSIGINLTDQEISQFAELKTQENYNNVNRL